MTPGGTRAGEDAEDLDIEEVLALVNDGHGHTPPTHGDSVPAPAPRPQSSGGHGKDGGHRATRWPDAREIAAQAARAAVKAARRAPSRCRWTPPWA